MSGLLLLIALIFPAMDVETLTAELHVETGMAYISQGLTEKALIEFNTALEISESAVEAYLGLARVAVINVSWDTAEELYLQYMESRPDDFRAPQELAVMLLNVRARQYEARDYAEMALELAPLNGSCWMVLAEAHGKTGNIEEAISWYTRIIIENELLADEARVKMGSLLFQHGELADAREILLPAASAGFAEANHFLALIYLEQNDNLRATDSINRYLFLKPNGPWADSARLCLEDLTILNN